MFILIYLAGFHYDYDNVFKELVFCVLRPCSECQSKSYFCAYPIGFGSYFGKCERQKQSHEIRFLHIRFKLYSYVVWNPNHIAFVETHFSLGAQMRFGVAFLTPYKV